MKLIIPKKLVADPSKLSRALVNALNGVALDIQIDFRVTVQTWEHKPSFPISSPSDYRRIVATDDAVYGFVNDGTKAHDIFPKKKILRFTTPFVSKTLPNQIMSRSGSKGTNVAISKRGVHHPGTTARRFDIAIKQKWDRQFGDIMQRAIDAEV